MALLFMDGFDVGDSNLKGYIGSWDGFGNTSPAPRFGAGK